MNPEIEPNDDGRAAPGMFTGGLTRQAALFGVFGGVQLLVDWATFVALTWMGIHTASANMSGRIVGAVLGFWLNGRYTFRAPAVDLRGHAARAFRFVLSWAITALLSTAAV